MRIEELETSDVKIKPTKQTIDDKLNVPKPFMNKCGVYVITGSMGSGKSSFLNSIMTRGGEAKVFKGIFDEVYYVTPAEVMASEDDHPFKNHPAERVFHNLNPDTFTKIKEGAIGVKDKGGNSALIIDDMSEYMKQKSVELALKSAVFKHRHHKLNIIITLLTLKSLPKSLRSLVDCFVIFKPKSLIEVASFSDDVFGLEKKNLKQ
jgi:adenosyl cobinamide kinase/adenosyl cobinamide phosphate guanylyltransferase